MLGKYFGLFHHNIPQIGQLTKAHLCSMLMHCPSLQVNSPKLRKGKTMVFSSSSHGKSEHHQNGRILQFLLTILDFLPHVDFCMFCCHGLFMVKYSINTKICHIYLHLFLPSEHVVSLMGFTVEDPTTVLHLSSLTPEKSTSCTPGRDHSINAKATEVG